jgi:hypothetical protein
MNNDAVHAGLDDLERDLAVNRLGLLRHEDPAKRPFADFLEQLVAADLVTRLFGQWRRKDDGFVGRCSGGFSWHSFRAASRRSSS